MKKLILTIGTALVLLTSCSKEELKPIEPTPIEIVDGVHIYSIAETFKIYLLNRDTRKLEEFDQDDFNLVQIRPNPIHQINNQITMDTSNLYFRLQDKSTRKLFGNFKIRKRDFGCSDFDGNAWKHLDKIYNPLMLNTVAYKASRSNNNFYILYQDNGKFQLELNGEFTNKFKIY